MLELLLEPLSHSFILRGFIAGLVVAVVCAVLSNFVLWRGWAFIGDAISHAILPGVVLAYIAGINLIVGALIAAFIAVLIIGFISGNSTLREDTGISIVFTGFFSVGLLLLSKITSFQDLTHILFGNIFSVTQKDLIILIIVATIVLLIIGIGFKELLTASFDPEHAASIGLSPSFIRYLLLFLLALSNVIAVQMIGVVLVLSLLVIPGAISSLIVKGLVKTMVLSVCFSIIATCVGFYISYYNNLASGPIIVLVLIVFFIIAMVLHNIQTKYKMKK